MKKWDVVVAGAGPAGAVAALSLARAGRKVLLVDDIQSNNFKVGESLPGAARPLLRELGLMPLVEDGPHMVSYGNLSAWGSNELIVTDFINSPHGLGWHLHRSKFDADIRIVAQNAGVTLQNGLVRSTKKTQDGWDIKLSDGTTHADWLIDATGRHAAIARGMGIKRARDDSLIALCAWATPAKTDVDTRTLIESTPNGWWYTAKLPHNVRVVVHHLDGEHAASVLHTEGKWDQLLSHTSYISKTLTGAVFLGAPHGTEACGGRLNEFAGDGWLATGDAALSFDPLSSQGMLNALYTGMRAGQSVHAALNGDTGAIKDYISQLDAIRQAYLQNHYSFYHMEPRWPNRPFWARRQMYLPDNLS